MAPHSGTVSPTSSAEANKAIVRRWFEEVCNTGNVDLADQIVAEDWISNGQATGLEGWKQGFRVGLAAFPDLHFMVEDMIAEADRVVVRYAMRGTHQGELMGIPPTGQRITLTGIAIDRIAGGKIAEEWLVRDDLGLMRQLGLLQ